MCSVCILCEKSSCLYTASLRIFFMNETRVCVEKVKVKSATYYYSICLLAIIHFVHSETTTYPGKHTGER
jgi:hypothetical protein